MTPVLLGWLLGCAEEVLPPPPPGMPPPPLGVAWFTSADGARWERQPGYAHDGLQSLGLRVGPAGALEVCGLNFRGRAAWWERFTGPPLHGATFDGAAWSPTTWSVSDPETTNYIDPQWLDDELWYIARAGTHGDPALDGGSNRVRSSPPPQDRLALAGATDPSPVRFAGQLHLFLTTGGRRVEHWAGEPLARVATWDEVTVPFATVIADELWLVAQRATPPRTPVVSRSTDGRSWSPFVPVVETARACTSPVVGPHPRGGLVLLCVEESAP